MRTFRKRKPPGRCASIIDEQNKSGVCLCRARGRAEGAMLRPPWVPTAEVELGLTLRADHEYVPAP